MQVKLFNLLIFYLCIWLLVNGLWWSISTVHTKNLLLVWGGKGFNVWVLTVLSLLYMSSEGPVFFLIIMLASETWVVVNWYYLQSLFQLTLFATLFLWNRLLRRLWHLLNQLFPWMSIQSWTGKSWSWRMFTCLLLFIFCSFFFFLFF